MSKMFNWVRPGRLFFAITVITFGSLVPSVAGSEPARLGIGERAMPEEIARWDIDVRPDGTGLPTGQGTVEQGEVIYAERCAQCHGDFGEGIGNYPLLVGGEPSELKTDDRPIKSIGSYWPYATTLFDYVRRTMPFGDAQSLTANETYAVTAVLLSMNGIIPEDSMLDSKSLAAINMPNKNGFYVDPNADVHNTPCMESCFDGPVIIKSVAKFLKVTPDD